jgi:hypothetical protein
MSDLVGNALTTITGFKVKAYPATFSGQFIEMSFDITLDVPCQIDNYESTTCLG